MLIPDVNVFLNVMNEVSDHHRAAVGWLEAAANGDEPVGIPDLVLSSVVRISTGTGMRASRRSPSEALDFCAGIFAMPAYARIQAGPMHWPAFRVAVLESRVSGKDIADAYLAAFAIENDATFVTFDRGFSRFPGLKVFVPE